MLRVYYRHTQEMIEKLESAGLGFYVKATETQQKLGTNMCTLCIFAYTSIQVYIHMYHHPISQHSFSIHDLYRKDSSSPAGV